MSNSWQKIEYSEKHIREEEEEVKQKALKRGEGGKQLEKKHLGERLTPLVMKTDPLTTCS